MGDSSYICNPITNCMKTVQNTFIRALVSIIIGVLLIRYREETVRGLTILIGALFLTQVSDLE